MLVAVKIDIDDRGAVLVDGLSLLVIGGVVEAVPSAGGAVDGRVLVAARSGNDVDRAADLRVVDRDDAGIVYKVIDLVALLVYAVYALLPDDDGVVGLGLCDPFGVDRGLLGDLLSKVKLVSGSACLVGEPAAEIVAYAGHRFRLCRKLAALEEARGVIVGLGIAGRVLVINQPVALGRVDGEDDVAGDGDLCLILVDLAVRVAHDVALSLSDEPAFKVRGVVGRRIRLVHHYGLLRAFVAQEADLLGAENDVLIAQIGYKVGVANRGIIIDRDVLIGQCLS